MKKHYILVGALVAACSLTSCSNDEDTEPTGQRAAIVLESRTTTVGELTERLRSYNRNLGCKYTDAPFKSLPKPTFTTKDKIKIAIADVKGGLRGAGGGVPGVIVGAAVQSLIKAGEIYAWKNLKAWFSDKMFNGLIHSNGDFEFADSVGYYHNLAEAGMYNINNSSHLMTSYALVESADSMMRRVSSGYVEAGGLDSNELAMVAAHTDNVRNITDNDLSFDAYLKQLKAQNPEDADYLDFAAEYLYTVFYANVDIDEYTDEVMIIVRDSNADIEDSSLLYNCIQIAYASVIYARNTTLTEN